LLVGVDVEDCTTAVTFDSYQKLKPPIGIEQNSVGIRIIGYEHITIVIYGSDIFRQAIYVLYRNPILFLMTSMGFIISVTIEAIFVIGLYNNNNPNYFPFINTLILGLFFVAFIITYFQLVITRSILLKKRLRVNNSRYRIEILILFIIYSIYALILVQMGSYEGDIRKSFVGDSDRFSLYTVKLKSYYDIIAIIPASTVIILFSAIFYVFFNSWMVTVICRYQMMNIHVFYESLKELIAITAKEKIKRVASIFVLTSIISVVGFIATNIAILPIDDSLNLYLFQFVISSVIGALYWPFFLTCLFLILSPRSYA
jgi:hypothetical protein